jgi:hypothetical protein
MKRDMFSQLLDDPQLAPLLPEAVSTELCDDIFTRLDTDHSDKLGFFEFWEAFESMYDDDGDMVRGSHPPFLYNGTPFLEFNSLLGPLLLS